MPAETSTPLPACPFCGGEACFITDRRDKSPNQGGEWIECTSCAASTAIVFSCMEDVKEKLVAAWSRRVTPDAGVRVKDNNLRIPKLYVGTMNDTCFIIDVPPRPAPMDYHNDSLPAPTICVHVGPTREDQSRAEAAVHAWNTAFELA